MLQEDTGHVKIDLTLLQLGAIPMAWRFFPSLLIIRFKGAMVAMGIREAVGSHGPPKFLLDYVSYALFCHVGETPALHQEFDAWHCDPTTTSASTCTFSNEKEFLGFQ